MEWKINTTRREASKKLNFKENEMPWRKNKNKKARKYFCLA